MRIEPDKRWALVLLVFATIVLFLLAIGLTGLKLSPGLLMNYTRPSTGSTTISEMPNMTGLIDFFRIALALALVLFPIYFIYMLIDPKRRKRLLRDIIVFGMILFFFDRLRAIANNMEPRGDELPPVGGEAIAETQAIQPLTDFVNNPPPWLITGVTVAVVGVGAAIIFGILWLSFQKRHSDADAIVRVAREAQEALQTIQAGGDLRDTIIQCYRRMVLAVKDERGIQRDLAMTPREFTLILTGKGLPPSPVQNLTRLFEDARYGNITGGMRQQLEAVGALEEIIEACRERREAV